MSSIGYMDSFSLPEFEVIRKLQEQINNLYPADILKSLKSQMELLKFDIPALDEYRTFMSSFKHYPVRWQETLRHLNDMQIALKPLTQDLKQYESSFFNIAHIVSPQFQNAITYSIDDINIKGIDAKKEIAAELTNFAKKMESIELSEKECLDQQQIIDSETQALIAEEINLALSDKKNWQQKLMEKAIQYKIANPVIAFLIQQIILVLVLGVVSGLIANAMGQLKNKGTVREFPNSNSQVVCTIDKDQIITIAGEVPYYYEVEIERDEGITTLKGYISKKTILKIEDICGE